MREAMFIKKNVDKWNEYQQVKTDDPDETAERFVILVDDLSYSKTFYPHSQVTRWINSIAAGIYQNIYRNKKEKYSRIFIFWKYELPLLFRKYHKILLFTFFITVLFVLIGLWGSMQSEDFMRGALPAGYVDMTNDNIAKGDPFGVYKNDNPFSMFVQIATHNISVAFLMVIGGFTLGIFTILTVWQNAVSLGAFQYIFFMHDLGMKSILVIWIHGTLEISSFIIAPAAGFIITHGILFPGTYSRKVSFRRGVKDALKILVTLIPILTVAAFFESYITHLMSNTYDKENNGGLPVWASVLILSFSLLFMVWYFVIYPVRLNKKGYIIKPDGALKLPDTVNAAL
jgi:uncharacterized membrane protein SpoIIM required for sporulation